MHVLLLNGSPRAAGNTRLALDTMAEVLQKEQIETEIVQVGNQAAHGCIACGYCENSAGHRCAFNDDIVNATAQKMREADGFIIGSPTYYAGIAGTLKCFLDRVFYTSSSYFRFKVASGVTVARRCGGLNAQQQIQNYLELGQTITPPSQYWLAGYGAEKGELAEDAEGLQTLRKHAAAFAWLLKAVDTGKRANPLPPDNEKIYTNFIR